MNKKQIFAAIAILLAPSLVLAQSVSNQAVEKRGGTRVQTVDKKAHDPAPGKSEYSEGKKGNPPGKNDQSQGKKDAPPGQSKKAQSKKN